jgi:ceramide glucosyltransferase
VTWKRFNHHNRSIALHTITQSSFLCYSFSLHILSYFSAALALIGTGVYAATTLAALRLSRRPKPPGDHTPPVTVLKPLKGIEADSYQCFRSHFELAYPEFELIFGVSEPDDPAVELVERLRREFPQVQARLVVCPEALGPNRKVSNLVQMVKQARYVHLVVNDADMRVRPEYLGEVMAPFADAKVGMVTCLYRARAGRTLWSKLEALGVSGEFMGGVMLARMLEGRVRFGLGATLACTREALQKIGGFESLLEMLADDYELGVRIGNAGYEVELANHVVETHVPEYDLSRFWQHQLRWGRTVRDARPGGYLGLVFTFAFFWAVVTLLLAQGAWWSWVVLAAALGMRLISAMVCGGIVLGDASVFSDFWLLPLRDLLAPFIWMQTLLGHTIVWRGERFLLEKGKIRPLS